MHKLTFSALLLISLFLASPSIASEKRDFSFSIDPSVIEINAQAPSLVEVPIKLRNTGETKQQLRISYRTIKGNYNASGVVDLKNESELEEPDVMIRNKIKIVNGETAISTIALNPNDEQTLLLRFSIDDSTPKGDYYFSLLFISDTNISSTEKSTSKATAGIGTNIILSVGDKGKTSGHITNFSSPFFSRSGPIPFTLQVENTSDHYIKPQGKISIYDMFGRSIGYIDIVPQYILANSSRYLDDKTKDPGSSKPLLVWGEKTLFGIYSADATVKLSEDGPIYKTTLRFVVLPIYFILTFALLSFVLAGIFLKVKKRIKRHE